MARLYPRINPTTASTPHTGSLVSPLRVPGLGGYSAADDISISAADRDSAEEATVLVDPTDPNLATPAAPGRLLPFRVAYEGTIHLAVAFNASPKAGSSLFTVPGDLHVAVVPRLEIPAGGVTLQNTLITARTVPAAVPGAQATCLGGYARLTTGTLTNTAPADPLGHGWVLPLTITAIGAFPGSGAVDATWFLVFGSASDLWPTFGVTEADAEPADATRIPWIHVPPDITLSGGFTPGGSFSDAGTVTNVRNFGTSELSINASSASDGTPPNADVVSVNAAPVLIPAGGGGSFTLDYSAHDGVTALALPLSTNDPSPTAGGFHNATLSVSADVVGIADTIMLIDASGSMSLRPDGGGFGDPDGATPADRRRWDNLADAVVHMADGYISFLNDSEALGNGNSPQSRLGIAVFPNVLDKTQPDWNRTAATLFAPVAVDTPNLRSSIETQLGLVEAAIEGAALTPIGEGLRVAMGDTVGSAGLFHADADAYRRWLVLMTDGEHNAGDIAPEAFYQADTIPDLDDKEIRVFSIAYSTAAAGSAVTLMQNLADNGLNPVSDGGSESTFVHAETTSDFEKDLTDAFLDAMAATVGLEPNYDPVGVLTTSAPLVIHEFHVSKFDSGVGLFIDWQTRDRNRVQVALISPLCERFEAKDLESLAEFEFRSLPGYAHAYISQAALAQKGDRRSRYGTWKLELRLRPPIIIEGADGHAATAAHVAHASETYKFSVFNRSTLRMEAHAARSKLATGEPIEIVARLSARGAPLRNARVVGTVSSAASDFTSMLATRRVDEKVFSSGNAKLVPPDIAGTWAAKAQAIAAQYGPLSNPKRKRQIAFEETSPGIYRASVDETSNPGGYTVHIVATGQVGDDGYRRERVVTAAVEAIPDAKRTLVSYELSQKDQLTVRVTPRDVNQRAVVIDTIHSQRLKLEARGAKAVSPLSNHFDGSYSQVFQIDGNKQPTLHLTWDGETVTPPQPIPNPGKLHWLDRVDAYKPGDLGDDVKYDDPKQALGPVVSSKDTFVSLGSGYITLGTERGYLCSRARHFHATELVVFTDPTAPASYRLYLQLARSKRWLVVGEGHGPVETFELPKRIVHIARIKIEDLGERPNGGVRLQGVGYALQRRRPIKRKFPLPTVLKRNAIGIRKLQRS